MRDHAAATAPQVDTVENQRLTDAEGHSPRASVSDSDSDATHASENEETRDTDTCHWPAASPTPGWSDSDDQGTREAVPKSETSDVTPSDTTAARRRTSEVRQHLEATSNHNAKGNQLFLTVQIAPPEQEYKEISNVTNENSTPKFMLSAVPVSLKHLVGGLNVLADPNNISDFSPPEWLDMEKIRLGRSFAIKYFFGLAYAEMLSLMMLFSFKGGLDPLIYTNKSSTPFSAFRRYLSTVVRVRSWYQEDIWDPKSAAGKNITTVRNLHRNVKERMNNGDPKEVNDQMKINSDETCCPFSSRMKDDFSDNITPPLSGQCPYKSVSRTVHVNQLDMSITQFGFVGLMILHPEKFGAYHATEKELEGFVHLWAGLGYLLGIEDRFNFCIGGLHECRKMSSDLINYWVKPNLRDVGPEWEHMSRCVVEGIKFYVPENSFEASLTYLFRILEIPTPRLSAAIPWWKSILFWVHWSVFRFMVHIPGTRSFHNWLLHRRIDRATRASVSWLERAKARAQATVQRHATVSCSEPRYVVIS